MLHILVSHYDGIFTDLVDVSMYNLKVENDFM